MYSIYSVDILVPKYCVKKMYSAVCCLMFVSIPELCQAQDLDFTSFFSSLGELVGMRETTLGANVYLDEREETFSWKKDGEKHCDKIEAKEEKTREGFVVNFQPHQIRTFIMEFV